MKAIEILNEASKGKLTRVHVSTEHFPVMAEYSIGDKVGNYTFAGHDDNGNQMWLNNSKNVALSGREKEVYELQDESDNSIAEKLGISAKSVKNYREKITAKGF